MTPGQTIGIIGTGELGSRFVSRSQQAGHEVAVYDSDMAAAKTVAGPGVLVCESPAEVAERVDVLLTCVTDPAAVEDVCLGPQGIAQAGRPADLLIETTTSLPSTTNRVAETLNKRGVAVVDAPVSRGIAAAEQGTLSIMVGGDVDTYQQALPILGTFGTEIVHVGALGAGHVVKLLNMQLMAVHLTALVETTWLARRYGPAVDQTIDAFDSGLARTYMTSNHFPKFVHTGSYASQFTLGLMHKDLELAIRLGHQHGITLPLAERAMSVYRIALGGALAGADNMRLAPFLWSVLDGATTTVAAADASLSPPRVRAPKTRKTEIDVLANLGLYLRLVNVVAAREALAVSRSVGLDDETVFGMIDSSSGSSTATAELAGSVEVEPPSDKSATAIAATEQLALDAHVPLLLGSDIFALCRLATVRSEAAGGPVPPATVVEDLLAVFR